MLRGLFLLAASDPGFYELDARAATSVARAKERVPR